MKLRLNIGLVCISMVCGCAPRMFRFDHVVVHESPTVVVTERSTESNDSQGKRLSRAKTGLPIKSIVSGSGYIVVIDTPLNYEPVVALRAEDEMKRVLRLRGPSLREIDKKAGLAVVGGYTHRLVLPEAASGRIEVEVIAEDGRILGRETIPYDVVVRGYRFDVDTL